MCLQCTDCAVISCFGGWRSDHDIFQTFEGDNTVLLQQASLSSSSVPLSSLLGLWTPGRQVSLSACLESSWVQAGCCVLGAVPQLGSHEALQQLAHYCRLQACC